MQTEASTVIHQASHSAAAHSTKSSACVSSKTQPANSAKASAAAATDKPKPASPGADVSRVVCGWRLCVITVLQTAAVPVSARREFHVAAAAARKRLPESARDSDSAALLPNVYVLPFDSLVSNAVVARSGIFRASLSSPTPSQSLSMPMRSLQPWPPPRSLA